MPMPETMVRAAKGFFMGVLFGVFLVGIFFELLIVLPIVWAMNRVFGFNPYRGQGTVRILIRAVAFFDESVSFTYNQGRER